MNHPASTAVRMPRNLPLEDVPALRTAMQELITRLQRGQVARLPALQGLDPILVVRWLYRAWVEQSPQWRPLVHVEPRFLHDSMEPLIEAIGLASEGWLVLGEGWEDVDLDLAEAQCRKRQIRLVVLGGEPRIDIPASWAARLHYLDQFHLVATDPSLKRIRRSLLSHCRSASVVHLSGPPGTGKRWLAEWSHTQLDTRPLTYIGPGSRDMPQPGQWCLFHEVGELSADQLFALRQRLTETADPPLPPVELHLAPVRRPRHPAFKPITGTSPPLSRVLAQAAQVARSPLPVLILGESGVGKEVLARALHDASGRGTFWAVDIHALNPELLESELFGHRKGSFTGADRDRPGAFRKADGGTLFLDELGNLSPGVQAKLLRVLQTRLVQPVGDDSLIPVDVRIIAATNSDLASLASRGEFREDLLQRINAVTLRLPPLRERREDILSLACQFLRAVRGDAELPSPWLSPEAESALMSWKWLGNVRELRNVMSRVGTFTRVGERVEVHHLGPLSPQSRRPVPLISTSSDESTDRRESWGLERQTYQWLTAVTLNLPSLRDRGPMSVRNAVLALLGGRPIRLEALRALENHAWWGNFNELSSDMAALRTNVREAVGLAVLERTLPHLVSVGGHEPIRVLMAPTQEPDGRITGLQTNFDSAALLVGRGGSLARLEQSIRESVGDDTLRARLAVVRRLCGLHPPAHLNVSHLAQLSRAHILITRAEDGLVVHALPHVALPVWATPLDASAGEVDTPLQVHPSKPVRIGRGGEVLVLLPSTHQVYFQLHVFAGAVAFEELSRRAMERVQQNAASNEKTLPGAQPREQAAPVVRSRRVWRLTEDEQRILNEILLTFAGREFKAHVRQALQAREQDPTASRLTSYLMGTRTAQYCARLYAYEGNAQLRRTLCRSLMAQGNEQAQLARFPTSLRRTIEEALQNEC